MPNRLKDASSPYLLQHADNPVDWYEWGPEAFEKARREDKPIFLSVGYAACHWCHVMAHESFEDPETAAIMNEHFVNVKVDREERPDVDSIYMDAVVALTGQGGWPMSVFLTPEGKPFFGGTYFPPTRRHGMPSFREVLLGIARAWREDRERLLRTADRLAEHLGQAIQLPTLEGDLDPAVLQRAAQGLFQTYDWRHGGWGGAPKFPQATAIEFLLRRFHRAGDKLARDMALHALDHMARGGIFDQVGGGFHRYAVDERWLVPHFEKMLYDNALLLQVYVHAWQATGREELLHTVDLTLEFLQREMRHPEGAYYASLDADSEGEEGRFYVWTPQEIREAIGDPELAELAITAFGVTEAGNFEGRNVLHRPERDEDLAARLGLDLADLHPRLEAARQALLAARSQRVRPATDDKVVVSWNGLLLAALAEAAAALDRAGLLEEAQRLADFLLTRPVIDGRLAHTWRQGRARYPAFLEDHAALGLGLLALYQVDFDPRWYRAAVDQAEAILTHFRDPAGGFFDTPDDHEPLLTRPKTLQDSPTPSGSAMASLLLLRLYGLTGEARFYEPAEEAIRRMQDLGVRHPTAFAAWLCAVDEATGPALQLALVGDLKDPAFQSLARVPRQGYHPHLVIAGGDPHHPDAPPLLHGRTPLDGRPAAYLCRHFTCHLPTDSPETLRQQLEDAEKDEAQVGQ